MHLEMSLDQMFAFRPLPELADYKTPIAGLFLTGASTHPGGGVFGASGVSAARVVGKALRRRGKRRHAVRARGGGTPRLGKERPPSGTGGLGPRGCITSVRRTPL